MEWTIAGIVAACSLAMIAFVRSRVHGGFYDADVYGMVPATHRRYAAIFAALAVAFGIDRALGTHGVTFVFAALTLVAIFYLTSFLRGAHEDDG